MVAGRPVKPGRLFSSSSVSMLFLSAVVLFFTTSSASLVELGLLAAMAWRWSVSPRSSPQRLEAMVVRLPVRAQWV
jgi:hypothetical protein